MNRLCFAAWFLLVPVFANAALSESDVKNRMISNLETIRNDFEVGYAPVQWKKDHVGWDLEAEIQKAKKKIESKKSISTKDFQHIVKNFFRATRDYHVSVSFYSTESATLPFAVKGADKRYFIVFVDSDKLTEGMIHEGDELITFEGKPIHDVILNLQQTEYGTTEEGTDRACAELMLTRRRGSRCDSVPHGSVSLQVKSKRTQKVSTYQLSWDYNPEEVTNHADYVKAEEPFSLTKGLDMEFIAGDFIDCNIVPERKPHEPGSRKSFIPDLGMKIWETNAENPFYAYVYQTPDRHLIGYVRIPHYSAGSEEAKAFALIIRHLQKTTEALVIDQINNPGGSVLYLYALASMLSDQALVTPKHCFTINQRNVFYAAEVLPILDQIQNDDQAKKLLGDNIQGYPVNYQFIQFWQAYWRFILREWHQGRTLTKPHHLTVDQINPHPTANYTKPILMLINELDFSGGDFFPAILQDNKRVTLLGTRTAGAGGYVIRSSFNNQFGIANYNYTGSIAHRVDQNPIENLGIKPDIEYLLTCDDLQNGYRDYIKAINTAICNLIGK